MVLKDYLHLSNTSGRVGLMFPPCGIPCSLGLLGICKLTTFGDFIAKFLSFSIREKEFRGMFPMPQQKILRILNKCLEVSFIKGIFLTLSFFLQSS
jgi:hypothetical protein